jgi:hypothetical protein
LNAEAVAQKIYLSYPTQIFIGAEDQEFELRERIATFFHVPITSIAIVGSAKLGMSPYKRQNFDPTRSDIDIAVISGNLFTKYVEICLKVSNGYDATKFPTDRRDGKSVKNKYMYYLSRGIFRPDLMPHCEERQSLWSFFNKISQDYKRLAKKVSTGVYLSEAIFLEKQKDIVQAVKNKVEIVK